MARRLDEDHHAAIRLAGLHAANRVLDVVHRTAHVAETTIADRVQPIARITAGPIVADLRRADLDHKVVMADHRVDRRTVLRTVDLEVNAEIVRDRHAVQVVRMVIVRDRHAAQIDQTAIVDPTDRMAKVVPSVVKRR